MYNRKAIRQLAGWRATLLDYQDIGVLLLLTVQGAQHCGRKGTHAAPQERKITGVSLLGYGCLLHVLDANCWGCPNASLRTAIALPTWCSEQMVSIVTGSIGLLVAAIIICHDAQDTLHAQHGLGWIIVALCFALLGFSPEIIDHIAQQFGVAYPPVLALTLGHCSTGHQDTADGHRALAYRSAQPTPDTAHGHARSGLKETRRDPYLTLSNQRSDIF